MCEASGHDIFPAINEQFHDCLKADANFDRTIESQTIPRSLDFIIYNPRKKNQNNFFNILFQAFHTNPPVSVTYLSISIPFAYPLRFLCSLEEI